MPATGVTPLSEAPEPTVPTRGVCGCVSRCVSASVDQARYASMEVTCLETQGESRYLRAGQQDKVAAEQQGTKVPSAQDPTQE